MAKFHNPDKFPYEAFVERRVSDYFRNIGYELSMEIAFLDLHFKSAEKGGEWRIECKGETSSIGVDFNTGIGQILKRMDDEKFKLCPRTSRDSKISQPDKTNTPCRKKKMWVKKEI
ncbi:MAG TPA: hypothetical protein ENH13_07180 [Euryarchaeota archaeon]|nr:hypothetical protein [Euryarchaeota archaeon]